MKLYWIYLSWNYEFHFKAILSITYFLAMLFEFQKRKINLSVVATKWLKLVLAQWGCVVTYFHTFYAHSISFLYDYQ